MLESRTMDNNSTTWDIRSVETNLLDEPIKLAQQLPCNGGEDCLHCKLLQSLEKHQTLASGLVSAIKQMAMGMGSPRPPL